MGETDDAIAASRNALDRIRGRPLAPVGGARVRRRQRELTTRVGLIAAANAALLVAAAVVGFIVPIGLFGALLVLLLMAAVTVAIAVAPFDRAPAPEKLREADLKALPRQTERWLDAQRPALPAPAASLIDQIGVRLETLSPQLATLDDDQPIAGDVRKLVAEQLPQFVRDYQAVPRTLRTVPRNGKTPDAQLVDGLKVIEEQIGQMSEQLAQGDLDSLATRGRYLEIKYRGDGAG